MLYEKTAIFKPTAKRYTVLFYNSNIQKASEILKGTQEYPVLAIDYAQNKFPNKGNFTYLTATTNTLLNIIQRFNIYKIPSVFIIEQSKVTLYKQDSMIQILK